MNRRLACACGFFFAFLSLVGPAQAEYPITDIEFSGPLPSTKARVLKKLSLKKGEVFDPDTANAASKEMLRLWHLDAYPLAHVSWKAVGNQEGSGLIVQFTSAPGRQGKVKALHFTGNHTLPPNLLMDAVGVKPRKNYFDWFTGNDLLFREDMESDYVSLLHLYHAHGYRDIRITPPAIEWSDELSGFRVDWHILAEGPQYRIKTVTYPGHHPFTNDTLQTVTGLHPGRVFSEADIQLALQKLKTWVAQNNYPFATVDAQSALDPLTATVDLTFTIEAGTIPAFRTLAIRGNRLTKSYILQREFHIRKGDLYDDASLNRTQQELLDTGLFSTVSFNIQSTEPAESFDLELEVTERATGKFETGMAYENVGGASFILEISEKNLLLGPPWRGGALQASLQSKIGSEFIGINTRLLNPRIGYSHWAFSTHLAYEDNQYLSDVYSQEQREILGLFTHPLGAHHLGSIGLGYTQFDVYDVDNRIIAEDAFSDSSVDLSALHFVSHFEQLDRSFRPTKGVRVINRLAVGTSLLGGDTEVIQYKGKAHLYFNPMRDHVFLITSGIQTVTTHGQTEGVPLPLREWLGGVETLRGFEYKSVSPYSQEGIPVGGKSAWWAGAEYMIPLGKFLDLSLYYELGNVSPESWDLTSDYLASDWGIGLLARAENFPIRFDLAFPVQVPKGDMQNKQGDPLFSFSVGYTF